MKEIVDELIIFSDLHAHNFKYGSRRIQAPEYGEGFYNSRLIDSIKVLDEIQKYAEEHKIHTILFGGDLFHRRSVLHTDAFNLVYNKLVGIGYWHEVHLIPGNHDYADRHGKIHSLEPFNNVDGPMITVWDKVDWEATQRGTQIVYVPYTDDLDEARRRLTVAGDLADELDGPSILLAHLGMQGAVVGSNYVLVSDNDVSVSDVPQDSFSACFFGHFHEHQQLFKNGWFIGSTHEDNWGDSGGKRGFLHVRVYDDNSVDFDRIETQAPKFIEYSLGDTKPDFRSCDFVRVHVPKGLRGVKADVPEELECANLEVVEEVDNEEIVFTLEADQLDPESALSAWVEAHPPDNVDSKMAIEEGVSILREITGDMQ